MSGRHTLTTTPKLIVSNSEDGIFIEETARLPGLYFIAEGFAGHPGDPYVPGHTRGFDPHDYIKMSMWDKPRDQQVCWGKYIEGVGDKNMVDWCSSVRGVCGV
jgi:hypothetical protein